MDKKLLEALSARAEKRDEAKRKGSTMCSRAWT